MRVVLVGKPGTGKGGSAVMTHIPIEHLQPVIQFLHGSHKEETATDFGAYLGDVKGTMFIAKQCCITILRHGAYACSQIAFVPRSEEKLLTLRRYTDRVAFQTSEHSIEWRNQTLAHDLDCPMDGGSSVGRAENRRGAGGHGARGRATEKDLRIGRPKRRKVQPARRSDKTDRPKTSSVARSRPSTRASRLLLTLVEKADLHCVSRRASRAADLGKLRKAALSLGRPDLPDGAVVDDTWHVGGHPDSSAVAAKLSRLESKMPPTTSPTLDLVVVLHDVQRSARGSSSSCTATVVGHEGAGRVALPVDFSWWSDGRFRRSTPFVALLQMGLSADGSRAIISGYAHPVLSADFLCPVDSDQERTVVRQSLVWHSELPKSLQGLFRIEKPIFAWSYGTETLDLLVFSIRGKRQSLVLSLEHLGYPMVPDYVKRKFRIARRVMKVSPAHVLSVASAPEKIKAPEGCHVVTSRGVGRMLQRLVLQRSML